MFDIAFLSASELAARVKSGRIGCEELLDLYLDRIERLNSRLTALISLDIPSARERARAADEALRRGEDWGPLHGVPITLKDTFDVIGMPSTWGVPELKNNFPAKNAPAANKFLDAGAIVFGKTNISAYHIGVITKNDLHGTTSNPWDLNRSPGGSSGGAGAAVAAGLTGLDMGVDFSGGIRNIAHYCGIFAHKPTFGITNLMGTVLPGLGAKPDLAVIGPLARSTDDLSLALSLIIGPDPADGVAWTLNLPPPRREGVNGLRVAMICEHPDFPVEDAVKDRLQAVADFLGRSGAVIDDTARPGLDMKTSFRVFMGLLTIPLAARRQDEQFWTRLSHMTRFFSEEADGGLLDETEFFSHASWMKLDTARRMACAAWATFFEDYDVVICPAAPTTAMPHELDKNWHERNLRVGGKPISVGQATMWGALATLGNLPATVAPAGFAPDGLPVGVQIIGPAYGDLTCLAVAGYLERNFQRFTPPPGWE
ncbi:MAG: amidase family protein [Rhodomicrobiaceae bacterium]